MSAIRSSLPRYARSLRLTPATIRPFSNTARFLAPDEKGAVPDALGSGSAKGRTGGGEPLDASSPNAPPKPKISNLSVPGEDGRKNLTEEQKKEVDEHNADFERKHDRGNDAPSDKVDKKFWSGERHE